MKLFHKIKISVFVKPEDIQQDKDIDNKVKECIINILPIGKEELEKNKIMLETEKVEGFNNRQILIHQITLEKEAHTNLFIEKLLKKLNSDQKELLSRQLESRLDEEQNFYIRLGKNELLRNDYYITESGDCFHIKMTVAAFPKKREAAIKVLENIFKTNT